MTKGLGTKVSYGLCVHQWGNFIPSMVSPKRLWSYTVQYLVVSTTTPCVSTSYTRLQLLKLIVLTKRITTPWSCSNWLVTDYNSQTATILWIYLSTDNRLGCFWTTFNYAFQRRFRLNQNGLALSVLFDSLKTRNQKPLCKQLMNFADEAIPTISLY